MFGALKKCLSFRETIFFKIKKWKRNINFGFLIKLFLIFQILFWKGIKKVKKKSLKLKTGSISKSLHKP
jgi:hypothetical protein